jgi:hypothetical protein
VTGTAARYMPYSTTRPKIEAWKPPTTARQWIYAECDLFAIDDWHLELLVCIEYHLDIDYVFSLW